MKADNYNYYIVHIGKKGEPAYQAIVPKFPGMLILLDPTLDDMHEIVQEAIRCELGQLKKEGRPIPAPDKRSNSKFKGKIILRTTPQLHEKLFLEAQANQMSLNKYIESRLK